MTTATEIEALAPLVRYLDRLTRRASIDELRRHLGALDVSLDDVAEYLVFSPDRYTRNLYRAGPWYHLLVICWRSGQRSPIHNHAQSTCGMKVLTGTATETVFEPTPCGLMKPVSSTDLAPGTVVATQDSDVHQISNLQSAGTDLVTLHLYSPPLLRMETFSLTSAEIGEYRPINLEHTDGSGI